MAKGTGILGSVGLQQEVSNEATIRPPQSNPPSHATLRRNTIPPNFHPVRSAHVTPPHLFRPHPTPPHHRIACAPYPNPTPTSGDASSVQCAVTCSTKRPPVTAHRSFLGRTVAVWKTMPGASAAASSSILPSKACGGVDTLGQGERCPREDHAGEWAWGQ